MNVLVLMLAMGFAAFLGAVGQLMLKLGSDSAGSMTVRTLLTTGYFYVFALTYGVAVLINIWAYQQGGKMSIIYPMISLSYIFAALLAWKVLGESISPFTWVGTCVIVSGIAIIGYGAVA